jgi:AcrR family transcriptional regulator
MARWEPDAQGRLLRAALDLFAEHGYEATTTAQIAERAGLTKTTLFRLFADKREIVFQGQSRLVALVKQGVEEAPANSSASQLMVSALRVLTGAHADEQRRIGRILDPILASNSDLYERAVAKRFALASALEGALIEHRVDEWQAGVLADLGIRAYYAGYDVWVASENSEPLFNYALDELKHLEGAVERLSAESAVRPNGL